MVDVILISDGNCSGAAILPDACSGHLYPARQIFPRRGTGWILGKKKKLRASALDRKYL